MCVINNFHKFLPFSRRPPGIQNQIPFEQAILDAVSDKAVTQETQFRLMGRSVPLRQQLLYFQPVLFFEDVYKRQDQYRLAYDEDLQPIGVGPRRLPRSAAVPAMQTMAFPAMSLTNSMKNLAGMLFGAALLTVGAWALLYSATVFALSLIHI